MQLESFLERTAWRYPQKAALICGRSRWSYAMLEQTANRLAHALVARGFQRGDRTVIWLGNTAEAVISLFATLKAGGVFVMVNPTTKPDKLVYLLNNCRARAMVLPASRQSFLQARRQELPHLELALLAGPPAPVPPAEPAARPTAVGVEDLLAEFHDHTQPPAKRTIDIDLAALIYTSGSTGHPKGVMLTHANMVAAATSITTYLENTPEDIILNVLPLSFDYGLYQVLMATLFGGTVVLEQSFTYPHAVLTAAVRHRVTGFPLVPTLSANLLDMDLSAYDLSQLRYVTNTGAALPTEHILQLRRRLPHVRIYSMYGLTECKRVAYLPPEQIDFRPDSVGQAMPNVEVYLVDDDGRRLGPGSVGELVVRGSNVMRGYWELPEETDRVLRPGPLPGERVLYTGDLFRMDEEGFLYFLGRKDDIIKSRGEKVSPKEVEGVLYRHPRIAEAAVVGIPDQVLGEAVVAFVAPKAGCDLDRQEVLRHCARHLEDFMVPRAVHVMDRLPKTDNGKIDKKRLAATARQTLPAPAGTPPTGPAAASPTSPGATP
ncbi:MAG TPA: AMP-dependent synthetase [Planctomycetaceae bacterium]|nr:AMP-dependent synthetase [Planctomycetaceae bacterium]